MWCCTSSICDNFCNQKSLSYRLFLAIEYGVLLSWIGINSFQYYIYDILACFTYIIWRICYTRVNTIYSSDAYPDPKYFHRSGSRSNFSYVLPHTSSLLPRPSSFLPHFSALTPSPSYLISPPHTSCLLQHPSSFLTSHTLSLIPILLPLILRLSSLSSQLDNCYWENYTCKFCKIL